MLDETFEHALVHDGNTTCTRDYEVIVYMSASLNTGIKRSYLRYLFRYCVEVRRWTSVPAEVRRRPLDDRLIDHASRPVHTAPLGQDAATPSEALADRVLRPAGGSEVAKQLNGVPLD